jgi:hypothetical protein
MPDRRLFRINPPYRCYRLCTDEHVVVSGKQRKHNTKQVGILV